MLFWTVLCFAIVSNCLALEPRCSKFDFEERVLEKLVDLDHTVRTSLKEMDSKIARIENEIETKLAKYETEIKTNLGNYETEIVTKLGKYETELDTKLGGYETELGTKLGKYQTEIGTTFGNYHTSLETKFGKYETELDTKLGEYETNLETKLGGYETELGTKLGKYETELNIKLADYQTKLGGYETEIVTKLGKYETELDTKLGGYETELGTKLGKYQTEIGTTFGNYHTSLETKFGKYETELDTKLGEYETNLETKLGGYETELGTKLGKYETELNITLADYQTKLGGCKTELDTKLGEYDTKLETRLGEYGKFHRNMITQQEKQKSEIRANMEQNHRNISDIDDAYSALKLSLDSLKRKLSAVAFVAKIVSDTSPSAGSTLIFTTPVVNQGDGYNPSTGIFKAPVGGVYMFSVQLCIDDDAFINFEIRSSTTVYSMTEHGALGIDETCGSVTTVAVLKYGEEVWVKCLARDTASYTIEAHKSTEVFWNMFSGALIQVPDTSVAFVAKVVSDTSPSAGSTLIFTTPVVNQGDGYNPSTGIFMAPVDGIYMFSVQLCIDGTAYINFDIRSSTTVYSITEHGALAINDTCTSVTTVAVLKRGEEVWVKCLARDSGSTIKAHESTEVYWNMFSGALIQVPNTSVAFVAKIVSNKSPSAGSTLIFTTPVVNQGDGYNPSTGTFKAAVAGVYVFSVQICIDQDAYINFEIRSSTTVYSITKHGALTIDDTCDSVTTVAVLKRDEEVWVKCLARDTGSYTIESESYSTNMYWSMFTGALIQEM